MDTQNIFFARQANEVFLHFLNDHQNRHVQNRVMPP